MTNLPSLVGMTVGVTGGTALLSRHLVRGLLRARARVRFLHAGYRRCLTRLSDFDDEVELFIVYV